MSFRRLISLLAIPLIVGALTQPVLGQDITDPVPTVTTTPPATLDSLPDVMPPGLLPTTGVPQDRDDLFRIIREIIGNLLGPGFMATIPDPIWDNPDEPPASGTPVLPGSGTTPIAPPASGPGTITPPGGGLPPATEAEFETKGRGVIDALVAAGAKPGTIAGDSAGKASFGGFPPWFSELQSLLCGSFKWGPDQEKGRCLLRDYANQWAAKNLPQPTFHSLGYFFARLGTTETNYPDLHENYPDQPSCGEMGGDQNTWEWCAAASNKAFTAPIEDAGFLLSGGPGSWPNNSKYVKTFSAKYLKGPIEIGDYVTTPKHAMTVVAVRGDKLLVVSGNAGGMAENHKGVVRIEEIDASTITVVKKHSPLSLATIQAHADDAKWLAEHGIRKKAPASK